MILVFEFIKRAVVPGYPRNIEKRDRIANT